jgi:D-lactate dehydrogenase
MCSTACPVGIDTGALVKARRAAGRGVLTRVAARAAVRCLGALTGVARIGLLAAGGMPLPGRRVPLPAAAPALPRVWPAAREGHPTFAYLPTCLTRVLGPDAVPADLARLCAAAGIGLRVPPGIAGLCCGMPFSSKGFPEAARLAAERCAAALAEAARGCAGVVVDVATCAAFLEDVPLPEPLASRWAALRRIPPAEFLAREVLPRLDGRLEPLEALVLHPLCSERKHGWSGGVEEAGALLARRAVVPAAAGCCGMAGEKAWSQPAVAAAAVAREAAEAAGTGCAQGAATSPTCAANLAGHSGVPYRHLISLSAARLRRDG